MGEERRAGGAAIVIAFLVATVSIVSAVVAGRAAVWSSTAGACDSTVLQESIERQQLEGDRDAAANADVRLAVRYDDAYQRSTASSSAAAALRDTAPDRAARLDLDAQAAWGIDLALWRFFRLRVPSYDAGGHLVFDVRSAVDTQLAADPRLTELRHSPTPELAAQAHATTTALVGIAVLFVAALFAFTLAEVRPGHRMPLAAGIALAATALAVTIATDPDTAVLLVGVLVVSVLVLIGTLMGAAREARHRAPSGQDPDAGDLIAHDGAHADETPGTISEQVEAEVTQDEGSRRFRSFVAVALAAATLLGAATGYLQANATDLGSAAVGDAQQQALAALTEHARATEQASTDIEVWSTVEEDRARAAGARQLAGYLDSVADGSGAAIARDEVDRELAAATAADALTAISDDHPDGPAADPGFPDRFLVRQQQASADRTVRQDLANEASSAWSARAASYVAVLATIAIAAYLLGLTLVLRARRQRAVFAIVGTGLVVAAALGGLSTAAAPDRTADASTVDAVARAFVDARIARMAARTPQDRQAAVAAYEEVIRLHPSLARAHAELAGALFDAGSPQENGYTSVATIESVRAAATELETARTLGRDDLGTRGDLGFYRFLIGLSDPSGAASARAVDDTAAALALGPELPVLGFNHAVALLAAGRVDEARTAYANAIGSLMAKDEAGSPVFGAAEVAGMASGAISDLELVLAARTEDTPIAQAVPELKAAIVAGTGDPIDGAAATSPVRVSGLGLYHDASQLWWQARIDDLDPARDRVSVLWLTEDPAVPGWHVLPALSGPLHLGTRTAAGGFYVNGAAPDYYASQAYLLTSDPHRCIPDGRYRVELYVNGRLAAEPVTQEIDGQALAVEDRADLGLLFCRPADWRQASAEDGGDVTFSDAQGTPVMEVARVNRPNLTGVAGDREVAGVLDRIAAAWPGAPTVVDGAAPVPTYLMGLPHAQVQWYDGPGGRLKVAGGMTELGTVIAVAIAGTADWVDGAEATGIVSSLVRR